jgi:hypothetical protein
MKLEVTELPYNPIDIDNAIYNYKVGLSKEQEEMGEREKYKMYAYDLLVVQLVSKLHSERNTKIRADVQAGNSVDIDPSDMTKIVQIKRQALQQKKTLKSEMDRETFMFDQMSLNRLRMKKPQEVVEELRTLLADRVVLVDIPPRGVDNILLATDELDIYRPTYDAMLDILAADILNPRKKESFITQSTKLVNDLAFDVRPNEKIEILVWT